MRLTALTLSSVALVAAFAACKKPAETPAPAGTPTQPAAQAPAAAPTGPVARVNGIDVAGSAFQAEVDKITQGGARNIPDDRMAKIRENVLNRLVEEELLRQEFKKQAVEITDAEITVEFDKYKARFKTDEQFQNYLTHGKTTIDEIKNRVKDTLSLTRLLTKLGKLEVGEEEVKKAYDTGIKMYTEPEQVHAVHILVKAAESAPAADIETARKKALDAIARLAKGDDFGALAKELSDDAMSREKGGDLGFFRKGIMVPKFEEAAFAMKPGEYTKEPVRSPFGFHVIKVLEHKAERVKPFDEVKDQIVESLKNRNMFKARRELVDQLKAAAKIEKLIEK